MLVNAFFVSPQICSENLWVDCWNS